MERGDEKALQISGTRYINSHASFHQHHFRLHADSIIPWRSISQKTREQIYAGLRCEQKWRCDSKSGPSHHHHHQQSGLLQAGSVSKVSKNRSQDVLRIGLETFQFLPMLTNQVRSGVCIASDVGRLCYPRVAKGDRSMLGNVKMHGTDLSASACGTKSYLYPHPPPKKPDKENYIC